MNSMRSLFSISTLLCVAAVPVAAAPTPVSPGDDRGTARVGTGCPTFSWGGAASAERVDLVVYRADEAEVDSAPVLRTSLPAGATSWTPSLGDCLEAGGRYAWAVRSTGPERVAGEWSEARLFEVSAAPSAADLERALAVLAAYSQGGGGNAEAAAPAGAGNDDEAARSAAERSASDAVAELLGEGGSAEAVGGGTTAIAGVVSDTTGLNIGVQGTVASNAVGATGVLGQSTATSGLGFGVVATSASPNGSAAFLGSVNGADLVLSSNGVFGVDGVGNVDATSFTGDGSGLTGITVGDDTVTSAKIVDGTITSSDVVGALYSTKDSTYQNSTTLTVGNNSGGIVDASCNDVNDLPIGGYCRPQGSLNAGVRLRSWSYDDWQFQNGPATVSCSWFNESGLSVNLQARILCVPSG